MARFTDKVVVITGAGGGIGREHALLFAREGARIVVNDLGGTRDGSGAGTRMADEVVSAIVAQGGTAVASYDSVSTRAGAEALIGKALSSFGRIDVLVNNAGILRDKTLVKMDDAMFDDVIAVHLRGTWLCTQAAARAMIEQGQGAHGPGGRIINTTSVAGLKGNFGQTNYAAAKAGIYGLTLSAAVELQKHGITVNAVAPIAKTRMTEDLAVVPDDLRPEQISPLVAWLASDDAASVTGRVFGAHGSHLFEYKMTTTEGARQEQPWSIDDVGARLTEIAGETPPAPVAPRAPTSSAEDRIDAVFARMPLGFLPEKAGAWTACMHFLIAGGADWSLVVAGGAARTEKGRVGTATCEVKTDQATFLGMVDGSVDGQQAFMQGKLSATNLADMMKYKSCFDREKAQKAAPAPAPSATAAPVATSASAAVAPAAPAAPRVEPSLGLGALEELRWLERLKGELFERVPEVVLEPVGAEPLRFAEGGRARGEPAHLLAFLRGDEVAPWAVVTDRMGELLRMRKALAAKDYRAVIARALADQPVRLTPGYADKVFHGAPVVVSAEHAARYAAATDDDSPGSSRGATPPMLAVRYHHALAKQLLTDPGIELNLLRLVFGEEDVEWLKPLAVGDVVSPKAQLHSVEHKPSGSVLTYRFRLYREGELVNQTFSKYFVRGDAGTQKADAASLGAKGSGAEKRDAAPMGGATLTRCFTVREGQSVDYAKASLDDNPIHLNREIARAAGFKDIINHGLCTLALAGRELTSAVAGGDGARLLRLKARFAKPVFIGEELTVRARPVDGEPAEGDQSSMVFEVSNSEGETVLAHGLVIFREEA